MPKGLELELLRPTVSLPTSALQDQAYMEKLTDPAKRKLNEVTRQAMRYGAMEQLGKLGLGKYLTEMSEILKPVNAFQKHVRICLPSISMKTAQRRMEEFDTANRLFTGPVVQELVGMGYSPYGEELVEARRLTGPTSGDPKKAAQDIVEYSKERRKRLAKSRRNGKAPREKKERVKVVTDSDSLEQLAIDIYRTVVSRLRQVAPQKRRDLLERGVGAAMHKCSMQSALTVQPHPPKEGYDPKVGRPHLAAVAN